MIRMMKILVPTDFSEHSTKAVQYGAALAAKFGAELHLLHSLEAIPILGGEGSFYPPDSEAEREAAAVKQLDDVKRDISDDVKVVLQAKLGHPFVEIVRYAKDAGIDLIVIGTHGRGAIAHMLLGSVAERVVRKAPCPVLAVRDEEHEFVLP